MSQNYLELLADQIETANGLLNILRSVRSLIDPEIYELAETLQLVRLYKLDLAKTCNDSVRAKELVPEIGLLGDEFEKLWYSSVEPVLKMFL